VQPTATDFSATDRGLLGRSVLEAHEPGFRTQEVARVSSSAPDTDQLLDRASHGDGAARQELLIRHRQRLRKLIALRLDRRLAARVDPSDVVQEALADADRKLADYMRERPLPFYPWLRQIAVERVAKLHRRHLHAGKRNARREEPGVLNLPDESALQLAGRLLAPDSSPSRNLLRQESRQRVQDALARLSERDREVLVLRYLEQLSTKETGAVLGLTEAGVKSRHLRALERLRGLLDEELAEE
jgi:RNA polymerase sigma-70 factor (ECF subfamily)